jgi:hypothetical protein
MCTDAFGTSKEACCDVTTVIHDFLAPVRDGSRITLVETQGDFPRGVAFNKREQLRRDWVVLGLGPSA